MSIYEDYFDNINFSTDDDLNHLFQEGIDKGMTEEQAEKYAYEQYEIDMCYEQYEKEVL